MKQNQNIKDNSIYYEFGKDIFGPFLFGFASWMNEQITQSAVDKVLFLARDGYMMQKAYEIITSEKDRKPHAYFYCSRKSLRNALLWHFDEYEESIKYINVLKQISVGYMLEYYGFPEEEWGKILADEKIDADFSVAYDHVATCAVYKRIYDDYKGIIIARSKEQDLILLEYIKHIGLEKRIAIVDIGWHGSMQFYLEEFFRYHNIEIAVVGLYVGIYSFCDIQGEKYGYLFNSGEDDYRKKVMCSHGILEKLFQSLEGSTSGYQLNEGKVVPVNLEYEYKDDKKVKECISCWQAGALETIGDLSQHETSADLKKYAERLIDFGMKPTLNDIRVFSFMYNFDGEKYYYTAQRNLLGYGIGKLKKDLLKSPWKTGFMKSVLKIPFPYYLLYKWVS